MIACGTCATLPGVKYSEDYCLLRQEHAVNRWTPRGAEGFEPRELNQGLPARMPDAGCILLDQEGDKPSDFLEWPCATVSLAMRDALVAAGVDNIDYGPVQLVREGGGARYGGYFLANVLGRVACVDWLRSGSEEGEPLRSFEIDVAAARGLPIFRLAEAPSLLVVSARLRAALSRARLSGLVFQSASAYDGRFVELPDPTPPYTE